MRRIKNVFFPGIICSEKVFYLTERQYCNLCNLLYINNLKNSLRIFRNIRTYNGV